MKKRSWLSLLGAELIVVGLIIVSLTFYPVVLVELRYRLSGPVKAVASLREQPVAGKNVIFPVDENFGIVIPKIDANAKVIPNVDPYNSQEYQVALTKGVAQARGTRTPDEVGNLFIFSHSSANFYEATVYNSVFYLLDKLKAGDEIDVFYKKTKYVYLVTAKKIVLPSDVSYLSGVGTKKTLTLMTCWPAGTTFRRLLVIAEQQPQASPLFQGK